MFEVTGQDVANLSDSDLRVLVARLAQAEIRKQGGALSSVTAGGDQDARDGGIDVRVRSATALPNPDFVPRQSTGFQVKTTDLSPSGIKAEMRPKGVLRDSIRELANDSGAYVLVSGQGSFTDSALADRKNAIRDALRDFPNAENLHFDLYDSDRLAAWASEYPGTSAWVRSKAGRPLLGWSGIGDWGGSDLSKPYLFNDKASLIDESKNEGEQLTILDGIARLRTSLGSPRQCIRLIGLSGLGKTRLAQALFEPEVGFEPLDPSISVYTDYSVETMPTARDIARELTARGQRAILIIDNCNPDTHSQLAQICSASASQVSLLTVEYDVRDDEPELTSVYRLRSTSPDLVIEWLGREFPSIPQISCKMIAEFSDGNFRVARAIASTVGKGETLGSLRSHDLFERIFQQRNSPNPRLLSDAEDLSLLYSVDGVDISPEGELARIATLRKTDAPTLYEALVEMANRGIVQSRGRFRAILPQAIANPLAGRALKRIAPTTFDQFCAALPERMLKSVSRRLGYLHDSEQARATVLRWLRIDGPLGDLVAMGKEGVEIVATLAPVAPDAVLERLRQEIDGPKGSEILAASNVCRLQWILLIKAIGYDPQQFDAAAMLLMRFLATEIDGEKGDSAKEAFGELFHIYLSGTQASPQQRRAFIKKLAVSRDLRLKACASIALDALLKAEHFSSFGKHEFGARARNWGWEPKLHKDTWEWFDEAIALTIELKPHLMDSPSILARHVRELWFYPNCADALERAANAFAAEQPWLEGWLAFRGTLRVKGTNMPDAVRVKLQGIIDHLKPLDLLGKARAVLFSKSGTDVFEDGEDDEIGGLTSWEKALKAAHEIGRSLANADDVRAEFLGELMAAPSVQYPVEVGSGIAAAADDLNQMWHELLETYEMTQARGGGALVLQGFLLQANRRDQIFTVAVLDSAIDHPLLAPLLPSFQAYAGLNEEGITRLRSAIATGKLVPSNFYMLACNLVRVAPAAALKELLADIARLPDGVEMALNVLHSYYHGDKAGTQREDPGLLELGRNLLGRLDFSKKNETRDYAVREMITICLAGVNGEEPAKLLAENIQSAINNSKVWLHDLPFSVEALLKTQPFVALNTFVLPEPSHRDQKLFSGNYGFCSPLEAVESAILLNWANVDPGVRYAALGKCISVFGRCNHEESNELSPLFLTMLTHAPNKKAFMGNFWDRLHPRGWSGSLADILVLRKAQLTKLMEHGDEVRAWVEEITPALDKWIEQERHRDRRGEESFE